MIKQSTVSQQLTYHAHFRPTTSPGERRAPARCAAHFRRAVATLIFRGVSVAHIGDGAKRFKRLNFQRPPLEALGRRFAVKNAPFNPR